MVLSHVIFFQSLSICFCLHSVLIHFSLLPLPCLAISFVSLFWICPDVTSMVSWCVQVETKRLYLWVECTWAPQQSHNYESDFLYITSFRVGGVSVGKPGGINGCNTCVWCWNRIFSPHKLIPDLFLIFILKHAAKNTTALYICYIWMKLVYIVYMGSEI